MAVQIVDRRARPTRQRHRQGGGEEVEGRHSTHVSPCQRHHGHRAHQHGYHQEGLRRAPYGQARLQLPEAELAQRAELFRRQGEGAQGLLDDLQLRQQLDGRQPDRQGECQQAESNRAAGRTASDQLPEDPQGNQLIGQKHGLRHAGQDGDRQHAGEDQRAPQRRCAQKPLAGPQGERQPGERRAMNRARDRECLHGTPGLERNGANDRRQRPRAEASPQEIGARAADDEMRIQHRRECRPRLEDEEEKVHRIPDPGLRHREEGLAAVLVGIPQQPATAVGETAQSVEDLRVEVGVQIGCRVPATVRPVLHHVSCARDADQHSECGPHPSPQTHAAHRIRTAASIASELGLSSIPDPTFAVAFSCLHPPRKTTRSGLASGDQTPLSIAFRPSKTRKLSLP